jgi:hypothetical protein
MLASGLRQWIQTRWGVGGVASADLAALLDDIVECERMVIEQYGLVTPASLRNLRRAARMRDASAALWYAGAGSSSLRGVICDANEGGVFLRPVDVVPQHVGVGTRLRVIFLRAEAKVDRLGIVRWAGTSKDHACAGFGIQFV